MAKLPRMKEYLFAPWWPMPEPNFGFNGIKRDDLPDDTQLHYWHGWWTEKELHEYGALPAIPWSENGIEYDALPLYLNESEAPV